MAKVLIVGCGSIGLRHIGNLRSIGVEELAAFDVVPERLEEAVRQYEAVPFNDLGAGLGWAPTAAVIAPPPHLHIECANLAIEAGCHVFIEKPIADRLEGVDDFLKAAESNGRVVAVGYNWRFHPAIRELKSRVDAGRIGRILSVQAEFGQYLPDWRPTRDYRATYTARSSLGGGIILDGSHEIDYLRWLLGEVRTVSCTAATLSNLDIDVEDTAEITLIFEGGQIGQIHLDFVQRSYTRRCKVIGETGTLWWDNDFGIRHFDADSGHSENLPVDIDLNETYVAEMRHFLACVAGKDTPLVDGRTGERVLEVVMAARRSAAEHRVFAV